MKIVGKHLEAFGIDECVDSVELMLEGAMLFDVEGNDWYYNYQDSTLTCKALNITLVALSIPHAADQIAQHLNAN